jgi:hypothetical protein
MYAALKYDRLRAKLTYSDFCAHAPQTRHVEWERVRSQMNKLHRPHRESGYIAKIDFQQATDAQGLPDWIMLYQPGPKARAEFKTFTKRGGPTVLEIALEEPTPLLLETAETELERELIRRGVTAAVAQELVREHAEEKITAQMERLDWLAEKKPQKIDDPAAYLVGAIRNDYAPPKGFVSKAERERRQQAKDAKERAAVAEQLRQRQERESDLEDARKADAYWSSLSPKEQAELQAKANAQADPEALAAEPRKFKELGQMIRRREYLRQLLANQAAAPVKA